ncbi:hypothetical protein CFIO01_13611 [Colletotrichum fioriniae PJ7]|uniref:Uncharacterized protein n=1 Tax=Colletotrichum fioriniae PJ7 TaxID=1445577 RepID=A0A010RH21_9PEZI|nr:hypothetical protein CFIO01_13611 [Colletotrichum fioriniae PJ7]
MIFGKGASSPSEPALLSLPSRHFNSHIETRGTRTAGVLSTALDLAKHQTHKVAIFPTSPSNPPEPGSFTLATHSHPVNSTRVAGLPGFRSLVQTVLLLGSSSVSIASPGLGYLLSIINPGS